MARVLGIDPGLKITGYGLVEVRDQVLDPVLVEAGVIRLVVTEQIESRLVHLHRDLSAIIERLSPDHLVVEKLFAHYQHPRTAILMAHARGTILLCAGQYEIDVEHVSATAVKKAITGFGHASKVQMQQAVAAQCQLNEAPSPPDVADAIAIGLTAARRLAVAHL